MDQSVQALREAANLLLSIVGDDESGGGSGVRIETAAAAARTLAARP